MKESKVNSRITKVALIDKDTGLFEEHIKMLTDKIDIGDFIKFMILFDDRKILEHFGSNFRVFYHLLEYVTWNNCYVNAVDYIKKEIADKVGIKKEMIQVHLAQYVELGLIKRIGSGLYMINPLKVYVGDRAHQKQCAISYYKEDWKNG
jgi:hypothetical protein